jgi:hypothetical protein
MRLPMDLVMEVEAHISRRPDDACAALVHTMGAAGMRGMAWAERRLGQLLRAQLRMWDQLSDYAGACDVQHAMLAARLDFS